MHNLSQVLMRVVALLRFDCICHQGFPFFGCGWSKYLVPNLSSEMYTSLSQHSNIPPVPKTLNDDSEPVWTSYWRPLHISMLILLYFFKESHEPSLVVTLCICVCVCVCVCVCTHLTSEPDVQFSWNLAWMPTQASPPYFLISCTQ
jgi:hypothetical protein